MIPVSIPHKEVIKKIFEADIQMMKRYYNGIAFDFDDDFRFDIFKEFIYAAAGMFKNIDMAIDNKELVTKFKTIRHLSEEFSDFEQRSHHATLVFTRNFLAAQEIYKEELTAFESLKVSFQGLIVKEKALTAQRAEMEAKFKDTVNPIAAEDRDAFENELKHVRRQQVDAIHTIGENRQELDMRHGTLKAFEEEHRAAFIKSFNEAKEKLTHQYTASLDYYGFELNESLFRNSENSAEIQKFKADAGIEGKVNLCKYLEYYLRNIVPDSLANMEHKERLLDAKRYCEKINR
jgi:hypothetical protein